MSVKHTWSTSIKNDSGAAVVADPALVLTADAEHNFDVTVPPSSTVEVDMPVTVADIVSAFLTTDKAVAIKTNSNSTPIQTFTLQDKAAGNINSVAWNDQMPATATNPFTTNITKFFITNASSTATASVRGGFLLQE